MTTDNFCFYLQNRLFQTGGQEVNGTVIFPPLVFPAHRDDQSEVKYQHDLVTLWAYYIFIALKNMVLISNTLTHIERERERERERESRHALSARQGITFTARIPGQYMHCQPARALHAQDHLI